MRYRLAAVVAVAVLLLSALVACGKKPCSNEGDIRARHTDTGIVHERCERRPGGLYWRPIA